MKRFKFAIFALCIVYVVLMALSVCVESVKDLFSIQVLDMQSSHMIMMKKTILYMDILA